MLDTLIRTDFIDEETFLKLKEYCDRSEFYINESYGGLQHGPKGIADGVTDNMVDELGLPAVPGEVLRGHDFTKMTDEIKSITSKINEMCKDVILKIYAKKTTHIQGSGFVRYEVGQSLPYHQDWTLSEWVIKHDLPVVHLSSVFYLNDDYSGGELLFSSKKLNNYGHDIVSMKPKAGTIIFFDALQWHASSPVVKGIKYSVTNFYTLQNS